MRFNAVLGTLAPSRGITRFIRENHFPITFGTVTYTSHLLQGLHAGTNHNMILGSLNCKLTFLISLTLDRKLCILMLQYVLIAG